MITNMFPGLALALALSLSSTAAAQTRKPAYFFCSGLQDGSQIFSGVIAIFDQATDGERNRMYEEFGAYVDQLTGQQHFRQRLTCYRSSFREGAERSLASSIQSFRRSGYQIRETGWTRDYVTGSGRDTLSDPGPAVRLVAPGEQAGAPRAPQAMDTIESGQAGTAEIQAAYARQQSRDQQRIDETRQKQAAYEAGVAEAKRKEAEYRAKLAANEAQQAEYQRQLAAYCKAQGKSPCAQARQID